MLVVSTITYDLQRKVNSTNLLSINADESSHRTRIEPRGYRGKDLKIRAVMN